MKKSVEKQIRNAFDSWDNKAADIGFEKNKTWLNINQKKPDKKIIIPWTKVAAIIIILLLSGGWINSHLNNLKLKRNQVVMVGQIHTLGNELQQSLPKDTSQKQIIIVKDTIVKVINKKVEREQQLSNQFQIRYASSIKELTRLKQNMLLKDNEYKVLKDSIAILASELNSYQEQLISILQKNEEDIYLKVKDAEMLAFASDKDLTLKEEKKKFKIVLFNKSKSSGSKAPDIRGVRL